MNFCILLCICSLPEGIHVTIMYWIMISLHGIPDAAYIVQTDCRSV